MFFSQLILLLLPLVVLAEDRPFPSKPHVGEFCFANSPTAGQRYVFSQWTYPPRSIVIKDSSTNADYLVYIQFCDRVDFVEGTTLPSENFTRRGWNFGEMTEFVYTGDKAATKPSFTQGYIGGDRGFPCLSGRRANVTIACGGCPEGTACAGNFTDAFCVCSTAYDAKADACNLKMTVSMTCPPPAAIPTTTTGTTGGNNNNGGGDNVNAGEIIGIIIAVIVVLTVAGCIGGYLYNNKVEGREGTDAIPGFNVYQKLNQKNQAKDEIRPIGHDGYEGSGNTADYYPEGSRDGYGTLS